MDLRDTPDEAAFRAEVRAWIAENLPAELRGHRGGAERFEGPALREWSRKLSEAGYVGLTWPQEYGGRGAPYSYQAIFYEEAARAESPPHVGVIGLGMAGPTIMAHGTEAQKARYLPKILSAEEIWCQGFSEPGAGSDLASLKTTAREEDGGFVLNGQKVWSSYAHIADFCILIAKSDPEAPRYEGFTYLIVDMHAPGVEVRPLRQITGEAEFNEIFLTDVEVPRENLLGEIGQGWQVAMTTLLHERATLGFALTTTLEVGVRKLLALARERGADDPLTRDRVAREWIELQALKYTNYRALTRQGPPSSLAQRAEPTWAELAELGGLGVSMPEELGGAGLGFLEEAVLFEELGRALYAGPYFATVGLALPALGDEQLARVASGEERWSAEVDGLVPDLGSVDWVVTEDGAARADGEVLPTVDETRPLGRLAQNGERTTPPGPLGRSRTPSAPPCAG